LKHSARPARHKAVDCKNQISKNSDGENLNGVEINRGVVSRHHRWDPSWGGICASAGFGGARRRGSYSDMQGAGQGASEVPRNVVVRPA